MNLYTANTGSRRMSAIGEPRGSLVPAETLDAIALLHALGVGSAKRGGQKRGVNEEIMRGSSRKLADWT